MKYYIKTSAPIGELLIVSDGTRITRICMSAQKYGAEIAEDWIEDSNLNSLSLAKEQLAAYFSGQLKKFNLPLELIGTPFQKRVWTELIEIPFGQVISYGELARRIGNPNASRAVGLANGKNPIAIVVPCHRVIGANGNLTGYGGGLPRKQYLLKMESNWQTGEISFNPNSPTQLGKWSKQNTSPFFSNSKEVSLPFEDE